jgi:hypothetical protein
MSKPKDLFAITNSGIQKLRKAAAAKRRAVKRQEFFDNVKKAADNNQN